MTDSTPPDSLADLLMRFPKCRVTIGSGRSRPKPKVGDIKVVRGVRYVRQRQRGGARGEFLGYEMTRNGRPLFEWVREEAT